MSNNSTIKCPACNHEFPIGNALAMEIESEIKGKYTVFLNKAKEELRIEKEKVAKDAELNKQLAENQEELIASKLKAAKSELQEEANKKANLEMQTKFEFLNKELLEKSQKIKESQLKELEFLKKEQALKDKEEAFNLELEKKLIERSREVEERVKKTESEKTDLKVKELEKKLADQVELAETMRRKAEQGSMQLQGEVQELALEELLRNSFPFDEIEEVGKGIKGADCIQHVRNNLAQFCGKIIYESKRTKAFTNEWLDKLKIDMRAVQADIAVIVTETLPKEMDQFGMKDGIWICKFSDLKAVSYLLRDSLIKIHTAHASQENKGDKMQLLYNYLTGNEFKLQIEAIVEGFLVLRDGLTKEKLQMEKIWKEREKQLDKVLLNTTHFYGSVKGIAGNAIGDINLLE